MNTLRKYFVTSILALGFTAPILAAEPTLDTRVSPQGGAVFFLLDENAVLHFGHAALLVGDDSGWDYYSFGPHSTKDPVKDNLVHRHFDSFRAAAASKELLRYTKQLEWTTTDSHQTAAIRERVISEWDNSHYNLVKRNCFNMVADAVKAGSFDIDGDHMAPVSAYKANQGRAAAQGTWPVFHP